MVCSKRFYFGLVFPVTQHIFYGIVTATCCTVLALQCLCSLVDIIEDLIRDALSNDVVPCICEYLKSSNKELVDQCINVCDDSERFFLVEVEKSVLRSEMP